MTFIWLTLCWFLTLDKYSSTLLSTCRRYETIYFVCSEIRKKFFKFVSLSIRKRFFEYLNELRTATRLIESTIKHLRWLLENQFKLVKQTSQNKLFKSFLFLFVLKAHEKDMIQIDLFNESVDSLLVSLLQWHFSSMQWSIYSHCSIYQWINLSHVSVSISESATRADNDWSRRQSQSFDSESATKAWTRQALLHACSRDESTVSLLQRRVRYWSRHRVSHSIVSLLEQHLKWVCYKRLSLYFSIFYIVSRL